MVRTAGIEPAYPKVRHFKCLAYTSFATSALLKILTPSKPICQSISIPAAGGFTRLATPLPPPASALISER